MTAPDQPPPSRIDVSRGDLTLRLAEGADEVRACQRLRYRVFYVELDAMPDADALAGQQDRDRFDDICDHLVVIRRGTPSTGDPIRLADGELVGTYRLLRQDVAAAHGGFYTQSEFDIAPMLAAHPGQLFLELGRSCVLKDYRTKPVVELLWQGIWNYVRLHRIDVMFGCASLEGADPGSHGRALAFLARQARAPEQWRVRALPARHVDMDRDPGAAVDVKAALHDLPPLIKGYLRLGCWIGDGAVVDRQFNTIDVLIVLPVSAIDPRYFRHFGPPSG